MAITVVSSTEFNTVGSSTNPRLHTFDIGTRTNGGLVVPYYTNAGMSGTVTSATWNGVAMTKVSEISGTVAGGFETEITIGLLYLANPTNGSNTLSVTLSYVGGTSFSTWFAPIWLDGFKQLAPIDDSDTGSGTTDPTITLQPTENDTICLAMYYSDDNVPLTSDQGTQYQNEDLGPRVVGAKYLIQTTAGDQVLSWSGTDADWLITAANFKAAAGAGFDAATFPHLRATDFIPRRDTMTPSGRVA